MRRRQRADLKRFPAPRPAPPPGRQHQAARGSRTALRSHWPFTAWGTSSTAPRRLGGCTPCSGRSRPAPQEAITERLPVWYGDVPK